MLVTGRGILGRCSVISSGPVPPAGPQASLLLLTASPAGHSHQHCAALPDILAEAELRSFALHAPTLFEGLEEMEGAHSNAEGSSA